MFENTKPHENSVDLLIWSSVRTNMRTLTGEAAERGSEGSRDRMSGLGSAQSSETLVHSFLRSKEFVNVMKSQQGDNYRGQSEDATKTPKVTAIDSLLDRRRLIGRTRGEMSRMKDGAEAPETVKQGPVGGVTPPRCCGGSDTLTSSQLLFGVSDVGVQRLWASPGSRTEQQQVTWKTKKTRVFFLSGCSVSVCDPPANNHTKLSPSSALKNGADRLTLNKTLRVRGGRRTSVNRAADPSPPGCAFSCFLFKQPRGSERQGPRSRGAEEPRSRGAEEPRSRGAGDVPPK